MHLIAGVSYSTAKINILDCDGFGLLNYFEGRFRIGIYQNRDCIYINTLTGEKVVIIAGGEKANSLKLIKGFTLGTAYITEVNECHESFVKEVFDRTLSSKDRKVFHDLNPKAEQHWYYENVLNLHQKKQLHDCDYGFNYGHFTIADNSSIDDFRLRKILNTYDVNSLWFQRDILGLRKQADGLVYQMFNKSFNVVPTVPRDYERFFVSNDFGVQHRAVFQLWGLCKGVYYLVNEYSYEGKTEKMQKTNDQYYDDLINLIGDNKIRQMFLDNAPIASTFNVLIRSKGKLSTRMADNSVLAGIQDVASALVQGKIKINDCCTGTIGQFNEYFWDDKAKEDAPLKANDDFMDCLRYFVRTAKVVKPLRTSLLSA